MVLSRGCSGGGLLIGIGLMCAALPGAILAEPQEPSTAQVDTTRQQPVAVPPSEIVRRADDARQRLQQLGSISRVEADVERIRQTFPGFSEALAGLRTEFDLTQLSEMSARTLVDASSAFQRQAAQLDAAKAVLERRLEGLSAAAEELNTIEARWRATQRSLREGAYPPALQEPVSSVLARVDTVKSQLQGTLDSVVELDSRVEGEQTALRNDIRSIEAQLEDLKRRLFERNTPALWNAFEAEPSDVPFLQRVVEASRTRRAALTDYFRHNATRGVWHAVLFGILLSLALVLRRRSRGWSLDDESLRAAAEVLAKPVSSALLVALVMTAWIYPQAPTVVYDLALLILLVPLLRLLADQISRHVRTALLVLGGLYVLQLVRGLLPDEWVYGRLVLLLETLVALATLAWLISRLADWLHADSRRVRHYALILARAGLVVFGAAILANAMGYAVLARLLTESTLRSALVAIVLYAAAQVLNSVITASLRTRLGQALNSVRANAATLLTRARTIVAVLAVGVWLWVASQLYGVSGAAWRAVLWVLDRELAVGSVAISVGDVVAFVLSLWLAVLLSRLVRAVLEQDVLARIGLTRGVSASVSRLVTYTIVGFGVLFALAAAGIDLSSLTIVVGALGVGIGFGLQTVVNNFVSGLILIFERPVNVGDTIQIESLLGTVKRIGIRASTVRTYDGADVIVPNADLISGRVVNWTLSDRLRRIEVEIGVKYGTDPERVLELLNGVANSHPNVMDNPAPQALFTAHGDSSLNFLLRFWTPNFDNWWVVKSDVTVGVNRALKEAGIEIPFPQRDLHLRSVDPSIGRLPGAPAAEEGKGGGHDESGAD